MYVGAGGSVLLCVLFHASGNAWSEVLPVPRPDFTAAWLAEIAVFTMLAQPRARSRRSLPSNVKPR